MSKSRLISVTDNNNKGQVIIDWTQVLDDAIRYDTNNEEEEEQAWLEAKRAEREKAKAERAEQEAEEKRACRDEERCKVEEEREAEKRHKAKEEREAKQRHKAKAGKGDEAGGEVKKVVMDPSCTHCSWAKTICEFLMDGNKKQVTCIWCNQSKGKCWWPGDGKDAKAGPKVKVDKGKKQKANDETPEPGLSQKKWAKLKAVEVLEIDEPEASGSRVRKAMTGGLSGLEDKLKQLIDIAGLIANNLAGLFELQEAAVKNSGHIADALESLLNESYGFGMAVSPLDLGSSKFDSNELHEEANWLKAHGEDEEDETMAEAE
ncbi:hypothetical protein M404DRAFT_31996 [Pisolithus tinctorius Marx 270]|uniref:Uncharacterized protein n=1 Tax=Pisolithus tinctorius Marx 270 TaxID=870435 RepID=A0A0C3JJM0_PISTI|nr:hypothetical protein M404DRAFT_31996 [Pisolithus tinctorius Marx 270]